MKESKDFRLTAAQRSAVSHGRGPCLVLAGPGSGKTAVLTRRIANLIESLSVPPSSILVLTFSKKAALDMRQRFHAGTKDLYPGVAFGTFHSVFFQILRASSDRDLSLISPKTQKALLLRTASRFYEEGAERPAPEALAFMISAYKTLGPSALPSGPGPRKAFLSVLSVYQAFLSENHLVDYDDMITSCGSLFRERPEVLKTWQARFSFILVDEFQDINKVQYDLVRALAGKSANLFVVGDDDQAIYGFRGASPSSMRDFSKDYPDAVKILLSDNFRSTRRIVRAAGKVIACNKDRFPKKIRAGREEEGRIPEIRAFTSARDQDLALTEKLGALSLPELMDTAVICRDHFRAERIEKALLKAGIPVRGRKREKDPLLTAALSDLTAYVRLAMEAGTGQVTRKSLLPVLNRPARYLTRQDLPDPVICLKASAPGRPGALTGLLKDLSLLARMPASRALFYIVRAMGYGAFLAVEAGLPEKGSLPPFLSVLMEAGKGADSLPSLLGILETFGQEEEKGGRQGEEGLHLLTMHASKGLEFSRVYLPDLNDVIIPGRRCLTKDQEEEERRLFYVAMTRAREELHLYYIRGVEGDRLRPCRFLAPLGVRL